MSNPVLDILIKATLVIVLALAVRIVWRRAAAATRHLIWALALGGILVLPIVERIGPAWHVLPILMPRALLQTSNAAVPAPRAYDRSRTVVAPSGAAVVDGARAQVTAAAPTGAFWSLVHILLALWLAGVT